VSTLDVVAEILRDVAPRALKAREIAALAGDRLPTASRTPETVVSRDLAVDVKDHGAQSRFMRVDRGAFVLKEALPTALYCDIDPYANAWTRNLIAAGQIAPGVVDERSIRDLKPADIGSYRQFHACNGIGVWSRALRDAGWSDEWPIFTGSLPCQPWSSAGKRGGESDDRHLWPEWFRLIRACGPGIVIGEQVASKDGYRWLDLVSGDFKRIGYHFTATELSAAAVGAPHKRQRIYFVAFLGGRRLLGAPRGSAEASTSGPRIDALHTHVEDEALARGTRSHGDHLDFETERGPDVVAYAREGGREILSSSRLHDRGQPGHDALGRGALDGGRTGSVSDAAVTRPCDAEDAAADRGDAREDAEAIEWRTPGHLELERGGSDDGASVLSDAECVGRDAGRIGRAHGRPEIESDRYGEVNGSGCNGDGTVELGDTRLARGGWDTGEVPGAEGTGEGERKQAWDLADELVATGADDRIVEHEEVVRGAADLAGDPAFFRPGDRIRIGGDPSWGGAVRGFWARDVEWIFCRPEPGHQDGRWRPACAGIEPLATRTSSGVGRTRAKRLRAYGNTIVRPGAVVFIEAVIEALADDAASSLTPEESTP